MISVAMTTYNGEYFVKRQLESIVAQSVKPDEIIVIDDCSTDNTIEILHNFAKKYPEIKWNIQSNEQNLGWRKNFAKAILLTQGDFVYLSDQDDYWYYNKIEVMQNAFFRNKNILVLACGFETIKLQDFSINQSKKYLYSGGYNFSEPELQLLDDNFYMTHHPGCSMAFRGECRSWFNNKLWNGTQPHDEFIWVLAVLSKGAFTINEKLFSYIRHSSSATAKTTYTKSKRIKLIEEKIKCIDIAEIFMTEVQMNKNIKLRNRIKIIKYFLCSRKEFIKKPGIIKFMKLIKHIWLYEKIFWMFVDIYCSLLRY